MVTGDLTDESFKAELAVEAVTGYDTFPTVIFLIIMLRFCVWVAGGV